MTVGRLHARYGRGKHTITLRPEQDPQELSRRLLALFHSPRYEPPRLPRVALDLLELTRRIDVTLAEVEAVIEKDPMLAAKVLYIAQSPAYAAVTPLRSLGQALARLGLRTVADIVLEASMNMTIFRVPGFEEPMERLRRHSTAVAHIARLVGRQTPHDDDYAFLCGLLHDVGLVAGLIAVAGPRGKRQNVPEYERLQPALAEIHEAAACRLAELWALPPDVRRVLGNHHRVTIDGRVHPTAAIIAIADHIARRLGFADDHGTTPEALMASRAALELDASTLERVQEEARVKLAGLD